MLGARASSRATRLEDPLEQLRRLLKRKAVIFLVSDFLGHIPVKQLALLNRRHDVIALWLRDAAEFALPHVGLLELRDAETGRRAVVDTGNAGFRKRFEKAQAQRFQQGRTALARARVETIVLTTGEDFVRPLMDFFERRART